ncbi:class I SAM-dependent methyltransferase [Sunxiuqinia sp. A32]|uniref:class I SAM-dependent methyltransferase n=1 Tax=Sunxiuqinia sp. A32 TaxID=3461496 RepID=UPI004045A77A
MEQLKTFFLEKSVKNVLDVGSGIGDFVKILNDVFGNGAKIVGTDPGDQWLIEARKRFSQDNISFERMNGEKLNFEDNSFDVVSISNALHHLKDIGETFAEMKRVLKPNGWIIVNEISDGELNKAQENQRMLHHFKSFVDRLHGITHSETYTPDQVLEIVTGNGVDVQLSFPHEKMKNPNFDELFLDEKIAQMESLLEELQGRPEYEKMESILPDFKERLNKYGFQMATQLMIVGQFK